MRPLQAGDNKIRKERKKRGPSLQSRLHEGQGGSYRRGGKKREGKRKKKKERGERGKRAATLPTRKTKNEQRFRGEKR